MPVSNSPGSIFVALWKEMQQLAPDQRTVLKKRPSDTWEKAIEAILRHDSAKNVAAQLQNFLANGPTAPIEHLRLKLEMMRSIDDAYLAVHPRSKHSPVGKRNPRPAWLEQAVASRKESGAYFVDESGDRLIARGPLLRGQRPEGASSADSLADRFVALSVVSVALSENGRRIGISHRVIDNSKIDGVSSGVNDGEEHVAFLAVVQDEQDLLVEYRNHEETDFVDFRADPSLDVPERVLKGLHHVGDVDIAIAPELVISEEHADTICRRIAAAGLGFRLFVAGSGHTKATSDGTLSWNETRVVNSIGKELWRQRKLWPAAINKQRAVELGLVDGKDGNYAECNASGDTIEIVDVDGLGRCVILICQDLVSAPLAAELLREYQPDWVFVPIMDEDVNQGRWGHQRAFAHSEASRARFLLVTGTAYAKKLDAARKMARKAPVAVGLAVGPLAKDADDAGRACAVLTATSASGIEFAKVQWRSGGPEWTTTRLGTG
jgi:hypothetical protein